MIIISAKEWRLNFKKMKSKNILIIGAVILAAYFILKKKKPVTPILPPPSGGNLHPIDMLPDNLTNES